MQLDKMLEYPNQSQPNPTQVSEQMDHPVEPEPVPFVVCSEETDEPVHPGSADVRNEFGNIGVWSVFYVPLESGNEYAEPRYINMPSFTVRLVSCQNSSVTGRKAD